MNNREFEEVRAIVYDESGIRIQDGKHAMVATRIGSRLRALDLEDIGSYLEYLADHRDDEIVQLLDVISTNVTSFYRESAHFEKFKDVIESWRRMGQSRFRIWCAASSTGEEPYTIALSMREALKHDADSLDWRLLSTDISTRVLAKARAGVYADDRVEGLPKGVRSRMFQQRRSVEQDWRVREELSSHMFFRRLNLAKQPFKLRGPLDVIFCRNVMIYFDNSVRESVVREFHRLIKPGGYLFTGMSESLVGVDGLFERDGTSVYRRAS